MNESELKKVLIADDDDSIRALVKAILEASGYTVIAASDGDQAIEFLSQPGFVRNLAFVILDVMMPGSNGLDVLTRIKINPATSSIPVIMLTGEGKDSDMVAGYDQGADYYILKPFTRQQLLYGIKVATEGE
jgi:DNA-binding response OmpR family regulator